MDFKIESLLLFLAFVLPGFLTSRLINIKTKTLKTESSLFEETAESLLRSIYIHLIIAPIMFFYTRAYLLYFRPSLLQRIYTDGPVFTMTEKPIFAISFLLFWLILAFTLSIIFGCFWDPLDILSIKLATKHKTLSRDFYFDISDEIKKEYGENTQVWIQARLNNGFTYRGELARNSFINDNNNREIILKNAKFFPKLVQIDNSPIDPPKKYDYVILNTSNCLSIEILKFVIK